MFPPGYYSYLFVIFFGDQNFFMATILQLKVAKRQLFEKVSLECWGCVSTMHYALYGYWHDRKHTLEAWVFFTGNVIGYKDQRKIVYKRKFSSIWKLFVSLNQEQINLFSAMDDSIFLLLCLYFTFSLRGNHKSERKVIPNSSTLWFDFNWVKYRWSSEMLHEESEDIKKKDIKMGTI